MDRGLKIIQLLLILMLLATAAGYGWIMLLYPRRFQEQVYDNPRFVRTIDKYVRDGVISVKNNQVALDSDRIAPRHKYPIRQYVTRKYIRVSGGKVVVDAGVARRANPNLGESRQRLLLRGPILDRRGERLAWTEIDQYRIVRRTRDSRAFTHLLGRRDQRFITGGVEPLLQEQLLSPAAPIRYRIRRFFLRPSEGRAVQLTIDAALQEAAYKAFAGRRGAAVVLDCDSLEILAAVSSPALAPDAPEQDWLTAQDLGPAGPLPNRAFDALYPPGSAFKTIVAAAALESRALDPGRSTRVPSLWRPIPGGAYALRDHVSAASRMLDFGQAFAVSSNVFFGQLGVRLGFSKIDACARGFGFGAPVSIRLGDGIDPWEAAPSALLSDRTRQPLSAATLAQVSIGQFEVRATPLQMACVAAAVACGGALGQPRLVAETGGRAEPARVMSARTAGQLQACMRRVVTEGTARPIAAAGLSIAGKTGTAETTGGAPHSWFIGFAPASRPRIAFAVVVEHGGAGSASAAPLAAKIVRAWPTAPGRGGR